jgi:tetratricopeptide (TPR) repeat protein
VPENPNLTPPRPGHVDASALGDDDGESSSKDNPVDLSPPKGDAKRHANDSSDADLADEGSGDLTPWDPHRAMKDIEVGDFYFRQGNYIGAESRYREALMYKTNDAIATYRLAVCLEKMHRPEEASEAYEAYLRILPDGPEAKHARKALERLQGGSTDSK